MNLVEVEMTRKGEEEMLWAEGQLLEKCEGLPSSSKSCTDTREHVFVREASSNNTWQFRSRSKQSRQWGFPGLGSGAYIRSNGGENGGEGEG